MVKITFVMKLRFIIADAQLEIVPEVLWNEPAVLKDSKRRKRHPSRILLYTPIHYTAMLKHNMDVERRGRPDITQDILKIILNHPLKNIVDIEIYIHTINNEVYWVNPETRLPHNFYQFEGLIVQLLRNGMVPPSSGQFMRKVDIGIGEIIDENTYLLHEEGEDIDVIDIQPNKTTTFVIGGFQKGDYSLEFQRIKRRASVFEKPLYAGTATCILLTRVWNKIKGTPNI